jgi:hypothetical protein
VISASDYYQSLTGPDVRQRRINVTAYWLAEAREHETRGDQAALLRCLTAAGWDVGVDSITVYAELLDRIASAAEQSDQVARAELARTHRRCLRERYAL